MQKRTGGPWGTFAHVDAVLAAKVVGTTALKVACRVINRQEESMMGMKLIIQKESREKKARIEDFETRRPK